MTSNPCQEYVAVLTIAGRFVWHNDVVSGCRRKTENCSVCDMALSEACLSNKDTAPSLQLTSTGAPPFKAELLMLL